MHTAVYIYLSVFGQCVGFTPLHLNDKYSQLTSDSTVIAHAEVLNFSIAQFELGR